MTASLTRTGALLAIGSTAIAIAGGCGGGDSDTPAGAPATIPQPTPGQLAAAGLDKLPVAPESERIDIAAPTFSNPTEITNPLFPTSDLHSVIFSGRVDGKPFHTETTLLPQTRFIEWSAGQVVEASVHQYFAYIDGRIEEVALDYYAQADDGSVWYLGEDVFDYGTAGLIDATEGTWLAGRDGPPEMIMPADPQVGDVHRAENIPGLAFEEVSIKAIDRTVDGPTGPVEGAIVARELHDDGTHSDKVFAPGYGEFYSAHGSEVEPLALAVPTDALSEPPPPQLAALSEDSKQVFEAVRSGDWKAAAKGAQALARSWKGYPTDVVPPRIGAEMSRSIKTLSAAIAHHNRTRAANAAIDVAQSALDLELRYRPPAEVDLARFELWARQVMVDAGAGDLGGVRGDVSTMEWIRDRFAHTLAPADLTAIDAYLVALRDPVAFENEDVAAAAAEAALLRHPLALESTPPRD
jgi:hypothetical protein